MTSIKDGNKSIQINKCNSLTVSSSPMAEMEFNSESESETSSNQSLTTYYNERLANLKLIYLIFTFVSTIIGVKVYFEHKTVIYKEFRFLYLYLILSITYWPVSIILAGIMIIMIIIKKYIQSAKDNKGVDDSLLIRFETISLTNYTNSNSHYSYLAAMFLIVLLGFYTVCIPTSVYVIYQIFKIKVFVHNFYKYSNVLLFIFLNLSKSIGIGICCIYFFFQKLKTSRIKIDLDEEFVKRVEQEIEQVKKCSGIFIADSNIIKKNDMFNRQMFLTNKGDRKNFGLNSKLQSNKNRQHIGITDNNDDEILNSFTRDEIKSKFNMHAEDRNRMNDNINNSISDNVSHRDYLEKQNSGSLINTINKPHNGSNPDHLSNFNFSPELNKVIIPKNLDTSDIGNYPYNNNQSNNLKRNITKQLDESLIKSNIYRKEGDRQDFNKVDKNFKQPIRISEKKTEIKNMIRTKTMITRNKGSFVNNIKKELNLDSINISDNQFHIFNNQINEINTKSPLVLQRLSKNFLEFRALVSDQINGNDKLNKLDEIDSSRDSNYGEEKICNTNIGMHKTNPPITKMSKDDMDLLKNEIKLQLNHDIISLPAATWTEGNLPVSVDFPQNSEMNSNNLNIKRRLQKQFTAC